VGQRREGFVINVDELLDLINLNPLGPENAEQDALAGKNVTSLALEIPITCLVAGDPVIGAWTTSSMGRGTPASAGFAGSMLGGSPCPAGSPASSQPNANWVPTEDCQGWVPPDHPAARGHSNAGANGNGNGVGSAGSADCPAGLPGIPRPVANWVPTEDCSGWVPPNHPLARSGATATPPGQFSQVSRLANPLVNEVAIGLPDKDRFNASEPRDDAQFLKYVTHPSVPALIQALFSVPAPPVPRNDLVAVFLTGIPGLNRPQQVAPAELMRLNTSVAAVSAAQQNRLGVIGGDTAGFPNGRRPGDDVVDIELRVFEGILCQQAGGACALASAPVSGFPAFTDGAITNATVAYLPDGSLTSDARFRLYRDTFPYLQTPLSGSPRPIHP
jgi:hypothetical protein